MNVGPHMVCIMARTLKFVSRACGGVSRVKSLGKATPCFLSLSRLLKTCTHAHMHTHNRFCKGAVAMRRSAELRTRVKATGAEGSRSATMDLQVPCHVMSSCSIISPLPVCLSGLNDLLQFTRDFERSIRNAPKQTNQLYACTCAVLSVRVHVHHCMHRAPWLCHVLPPWRPPLLWFTRVKTLTCDSFVHHSFIACS